jgi:hyperpolarization activated cyclic nucleotide-gated potassium channel 1
MAVPIKNDPLVYMLVSGRVNYIEEFTFRNSKETKLVVFKSMINGSYFGETEIILNRKRDFYVQCEQFCEFYFLDR